MTTITGGHLPPCYGTNYCNIKTKYPTQCLAIVNVVDGVVGHNVSIYRPGDVEAAFAILHEKCISEGEEVLDIFAGVFLPCCNVCPSQQKRLPKRQKRLPNCHPLLGHRKSLPLDSNRGEVHRIHRYAFHADLYGKENGYLAADYPSILKAISFCEFDGHFAAILAPNQ